MDVSVSMLAVSEFGMECPWRERCWVFGSGTAWGEGVWDEGEKKREKEK